MAKEANRKPANSMDFLGIEADFGPENADTFRRDLHPDLLADYVLANPTFNDSDWFRKDDDVRFFSFSASNGERAGVRCRSGLQPAARWPQPQSRAKLPSIGKDVDDAMVALERESKRLLEEAKTRVEQLIEEAVKS